MLEVGLTPLDHTGRWMGGRYYLQHLVRCVAALPAEERIGLSDIYWNTPPPSDPLAEVRPLVHSQRVIRFPATASGRLVRKISRTLRGITDARDLLPGIDATFPVPIVANQGIPSIFWMPDFQHEHHRQLYDPRHHAEIVAAYTALVEGAARVVVSSQFGARDFAHFYPTHASKCDVLTFCSVPDPDWWALDPAEVARVFAIEGPFFILSNQFTEQKNHLTVIEAARMLRERGSPVVIVCTGSDYDFRGMNYFARVQQYVRDHGLEQEVRFVGLLPRAQQMALTRRAVAALQPSRFEGWSTTIEDAKALGKYVVASEFPVHREQLEGRACTFVDPSDSGGWAAAMSSVMETRVPGPHLDEEAAASVQLQTAIRDCGSTFVSIVRRALGSRGMG